MRIEGDDESFCAGTAAMCKSSNEGSEEFHMTITIIALVPGERNCQRGPAGQGQKNVGGDENMHYRGRDKKNGATRKDAKSGESWVVKVKSKWLCFVNNHGFQRPREETHQPVSLAGKQRYKTIESWGRDGANWPPFMLSAVYWVGRVVHNRFGLIMGSSKDHHDIIEPRRRDPIR
jgi:hypothetical protein